MARILLVDDEQPIQTLLSFPLQRDGYEVVQAADGPEALERFDEQVFDLVVLDVMLPDLDGFEVIRLLREGGARIPVVFLTARDSTDDKIRGLTLGGDDYVTKPFSLDEVLARIRAVLRRSTGPQRPAESPRLSFAVRKRIGEV